MGNESPWLLRDGTPYARASSVSSDPRSFARICPVVLANKADIGTQAHSAIHAHLLGTLVLCRQESWPYYESWLRWYQDKRPIYLATEKRYWSPELKLTGQIDGLITMPDSDEPVLIDYKTSSVAMPSTWCLQASLYCLLLQKHAVKCSRAVFLQLRSKKSVDALGKVTLEPRPAVEHHYKITPDHLNQARLRLDQWHTLNAPNRLVA